MKLTIFTPTFNRAYTLGDLYESLKKQTSKNFEWVVVDDGSTDDTEALVKKWIAEEAVDIVYKKQPNQGKHIAINTGVKIATGELFFTVDSDDFLSPDATEKILSHWKKYGAGKENVSGIISYRRFRDGRFIGKLIPREVQYCTLRDTSQKFDSHGDKVVVYRTDILRCYPYPQFEREKFLGESYVYNLIDDHYTMSIMDDAIYCCEHRPDGLSFDFRRLYRNNPKGFYLIFSQQTKYLTTARGKLKNAAHLDALAIRLGRWILGKPHCLWRFLALPLGIFLYLKIFVLKISDVKWYLRGTKR